LFARVIFDHLIAGPFDRLKIMIAGPFDRLKIMIVFESICRTKKCSTFFQSTAPHVTPATPVMLATKETTVATVPVTI
jgi:hypothetical protein